ncbi:MAG TPA: hypothetical protein VFE09_04030 [Rubrobacteraceae bacterium]|nr:hypothetical protein [Rubrobacteraceae bacterium]
MKKSVLLAAILVIALATAAPVALAQTETASRIQGSITDISGAVVLVEEDPADEWGSAKGAFTVTEETEILRQQGDELLPATLEELWAGQQVTATYVGPVAESYPLQGRADSIIILEEPPMNGPGDELPCLLPEGCVPEGGIPQ